MRKSILFVMAILLLTAMSFSVFAQTGSPVYKEIKIVSDSWHNLTMENGTGLYFDLIRKVFEPLGIKVKIEIVHYARSVKNG